MNCRAGALFIGGGLFCCGLLAKSAQGKEYRAGHYLFHVRVEGEFGAAHARCLVDREVVHHLPAHKIVSLSTPKRAKSGEQERAAGRAGSEKGIDCANECWAHRHVLDRAQVPVADVCDGASPHGELSVAKVAELVLPPHPQEEREEEGDKAGPGLQVGGERPVEREAREVDVGAEFGHHASRDEVALVEDANDHRGHLQNRE